MTIFLLNYNLRSVLVLVGLLSVVSIECTTANFRRLRIQVRILITFNYTCALASCGAVYCYRSCLCVCVFATVGRVGGRAGGVRTLLQPACLRLSERFFPLI